MDEDAKKSLLRSIPYGLYAACTRGPDGEDHVFLLSWVTQASFDPPLIVCCVHRESTAYQHLTDGEQAIAISLLGEDQAEVATRILGDPGIEEDSIAGEPTKRAANGCAMLTSTLGTIEARVTDEAGQGDHAVFVCEIEDAHAYREGEPLTHETSGMTYAG